MQQYAQERRGKVHTVTVKCYVITYEGIPTAFEYSNNVYFLSSEILGYTQSKKDLFNSSDLSCNTGLHNFPPPERLLYKLEITFSFSPFSFSKEGQVFFDKILEPKCVML